MKLACVLTLTLLQDAALCFQISPSQKYLYQLSHTNNTPNTTQQYISYRTFNTQRDLFDRFRRSKKTDDNVKSIDLQGAETVDTSPHANSEPTTSTTTDITNKPKSTEQIASDLRKQAAKARLEADKMDIALTLEKISGLEKRLELLQQTSDREKTKDEMVEISFQIEQLNKKLIATSDKKVTAVSNVSDAVVKPTATVSKEELPGFYSFVPLTDNEVKEKVDNLLAAPDFLPLIVAKTAGIDADASNIAAIAKDLVIKMHQDQYLDDRDKQRLMSEVYVPLNHLELERRERMFKKSPTAIQEISAKVSGFENANNVTAVILKMHDDQEAARLKAQKDAGLQNALKSFNPGASAQFDAENGNEKLDTKTGGEGGWGSWLFNNQERSREDRYFETMFPPQTRKEGATPIESEVVEFMEKVISPSTFIVDGRKPEKVSGGYIIRGVNKKESPSQLIEALDNDIAKSSFEGKFNVCYIQDPTPVTEDQLMLGDRSPTLYVTGKDLSPRANKLLLTAVSSIGMLFLATFSLAYFTLNSSIDNMIQAGTVDVDQLTNLVTPLLGSMIFVQFGHELAHRVVAEMNGFKITFPTFIPSPQYGLTSVITSLKTSPKDRKALFDFALAGPLVGILLSLGLLYEGLELTAYADEAASAYFPEVPVIFLRESILASELVAQELGRTILQAPNPFETLVPVHPFVISGIASLIINSFALTPFGTTDGGRIMLSLFGRSGALLVRILVLLIGLFSVLTGSGSFIGFLPFLVFFQNQLEIPLRNEVDGVDEIRSAIAVSVAILVTMCVVPL